MIKFTAEDLVSEDFNGNLFDLLEFEDDNKNKRIAIELEPYEVKGFFGMKTKYRLFIKELDEEPKVEDKKVEE